MDDEVAALLADRSTADILVLSAVLDFRRRKLLAELKRTIRQARAVGAVLRDREGVTDGDAS